MYANNVLCKWWGLIIQEFCLASGGKLALIKTAADSAVATTEIETVLNGKAIIYQLPLFLVIHT